MASGFGESTGKSPAGPSCSSNNNNNGASNFECNICFDLAQDPIITLCGHLFCWPCLYRWLQVHSKSQECPVCKALIEEKTLVPLYGRGKASTDPRSKSIPNDDIPHRPSGQRPETAPPREPNNSHQHGFGLMGGSGGVSPTPTIRFWDYFTLSGAFGGLIPTLVNFQMHGFHAGAMFGGATNFPHGYAPSFHETDHAHRSQEYTGQRQHDYHLKKLLLFVVCFVTLALIWH